MDLIIGLIILGLILISFEIIVPGGVLGFLGAVSLISACAFAYDMYGGLGMLGIFVACIVLVTVTLIIEFKFLPKTQVGKRFFLKNTIQAKSTNEQGTDELIGQEGVAVTQLTPTGTVCVNDINYEAFSQDGLINEDEAITVISRDNFRIIVRKTKEQ